MFPPGGVFDFDFEYFDFFAIFEKQCPTANNEFTVKKCKKYVLSSID